MIGQPDAWNTVGFSNTSLLDYYGVPAQIRQSADVTHQFLEYAYANRGPKRDARPAAIPDRCKRGILYVNLYRDENLGFRS